MLVQNMYMELKEINIPTLVVNQLMVLLQVVIFTLELELGIGKGKKLYDKRQDLAKKDAQRQIERGIE